MSIISPKIPQAEVKMTDFLALYKWIKPVPNPVCDSGNSLHRNHQNKGRERDSCTQLQAVFIQTCRTSTIFFCTDPKSQWPQVDTKLSCAMWCSQKGAETMTKIVSFGVTCMWGFWNLSPKTFYDKDAIFLSQKISQENFRFFRKQPKNLNPEGKTDVAKITCLNFSHC